MYVIVMFDYRLNYITGSPSGVVTKFSNISQVGKAGKLMLF